MTPERPAEDIALRAHRAAVQHMMRLIEALHYEEDGEDVDWAELGAAGVYCGCMDCDVREVATVVVAELKAGGVIRVLDPDAKEGFS